MTTIIEEQEVNSSLCPSCGSPHVEGYDRSDVGNSYVCMDCQFEFKALTVELEFELHAGGETVQPYPEPESVAGRILTFALRCDASNYTDTNDAWELLQRAYFRLTRGRRLDTDTENHYQRDEA